MSNSLTTAEKITKARANLVMMHPFFATLVMRMDIRPLEGIGTMGTDGRSIVYEPKFVDRCTVSELVAVLAHEALHPAFLHHTRKGGREHRLWNQACDYPINYVIKNSGMSLPNWPDMPICDDDKLGVLSAEEVYEILKKTSNNKGSGPVSIGIVFQGNEGSDGKGSDRDGSSEAKEFAGAVDWTKELEQEWKQALSEALATAKARGNVPAGMERFIENFLQPTYNWRDLLLRFCSQKKVGKVNWKRFNKRMLSVGLFMPTRKAEPVGTFVVAIDTSGSIGRKELEEFGGEFNGIVKSLMPKKIVVLWVDAAVAHVQEFAPEDTIVFEPKGGGGTAFEPAFNWVEESGEKPDAFIYMTDGYGSFPASPPDYPCVWVINNNNVTPPWGEHIVLEVS